MEQREEPAIVGALDRRLILSYPRDEATRVEAVIGVE